ncbi:MAG: YczE/YyaS/YitT family protein [Gaiellaceae bacterium]
MRTAPVLRGGPVVRSIWLVAGLFLFACGIVCFLESRLGLAPWDVLHQGIARRTPLSFGVANEVVGVIVLGIAWLLGARVGLGTIANAVLIGLFVLVLQPLHAVQSLAHWPVAGRAGLLAAGLVCFGVGSALYIGAALGAGPRDSLMLVGSLRAGMRLGAVRAVIETTVLIAGFLLGGRVGVGTLTFAALIGPSVEGSFWLISRTPIARPRSPRAVAPARADTPGAPL